MRVLIADKLPEESRSRLEQGGFEIFSDPTLSGESLEACLSEFNPEVLIVRSTRVDANHVARGLDLALIVRAGAGVNTIDLSSCASRGVYVANCPGKNAVAVAELTVGLMLALDRRIPDNVADLRGGRWNKKKYAKAEGLRDRRIGILGLGDIGREVARIAQALGMQVYAWSRSLDAVRADELGVTLCADPVSLAACCDVITVHMALTDQTRGFVGTKVFEAMKDGALFINTARAELVDEEALLVALNSGKIRAGLDVFSDEPRSKEGDWRHVLADHPAVYGTHHIGASTDQAQVAVGNEACRVVESYRESGRVPNCVNLDQSPREACTLVVRHLDKVGVLAGVLDALRVDNINVGAMENLIFDGYQAACARMSLRSTPRNEVLERIRERADVLSVAVIQG